MKNAEGKLHAVSPDGALPPEQKALQYLQKAEEEYETQIQIQRQQGGGGGGGGGQMAQDLADLFEMELDKMANQYETRQQASQQQIRSEARRAAGEAEGARAHGRSRKPSGSAAAPRSVSRPPAAGRDSRSASWPIRSRKRRAGSSSCRATRTGRS